MKKIFLLFIILLTISCVDSSDDDILNTNFYVKNTSKKTITFKASVFKRISNTVVSSSFDVYPNDSVLARTVGFKKDGTTPQGWFESFEITPVSGIEMNNPNLTENWIKYNVNNTPTYVFKLNKN